MSHSRIARWILKISHIYKNLNTTHFQLISWLFLALTNSSQEHYEQIHKVTMNTYPNDPFLSFDQIKQHVEWISGVVPLLHDMCINTCHAFTDPYTDLNKFPTCSTSRHHPETGKAGNSSQWFQLALSFKLSIDLPKQPIICTISKGNLATILSMQRITMVQLKNTMISLARRTC